MGRILLSEVPLYTVAHRSAQVLVAYSYAWKNCRLLRGKKDLGTCGRVSPASGRDYGDVTAGDPKRDWIS